MTIDVIILNPWSMCILKVKNIFLRMQPKKNNNVTPVLKN